MRIINIFHLVADSRGGSRILFVARTEGAGKVGLAPGVIHTAVIRSNYDVK